MVWTPVSEHNTEIDVNSGEYLKNFDQREDTTYNVNYGWHNVGSEDGVRQSMVEFEHIGAIDRHLVADFEGIYSEGKITITNTDGSDPLNFEANVFDTTWLAVDGDDITLQPFETWTSNWISRPNLGAHQVWYSSPSNGVSWEVTWEWRVPYEIVVE